jgi:hypothetical protein
MRFSVSPPSGRCIGSSCDLIQSGRPRPPVVFRATNGLVGVSSCRSKPLRFRHPLDRTYEREVALICHTGEGRWPVLQKSCRRASSPDGLIIDVALNSGSDIRSSRLISNSCRSGWEDVRRDERTSYPTPNLKWHTTCRVGRNPQADSANPTYKNFVGRNPCGFDIFPTQSPQTSRSGCAPPTPPPSNTTHSPPASCCG